MRVVRYARRRGSGGGGVHAGGDGIVRELELLAPATVTSSASGAGVRRTACPAAAPAPSAKTPCTRGERTVRLPGKVTFHAQAGDRLTIATPGGGGHGDPMRAKFWASVLSGEPLTIE